MLQIALKFQEKGTYAPYREGRHQKKISGYQIDKANYRILKSLAPDHMQDIPRSRIVDYHYVQVDNAIVQQGNYFLFSIEETQLSQIEAITKVEHRPQVYLWREGVWWSFPQLETYNTGEMKTVTITMADIFGNSRETREHQIERTGVRLRESYEPAKGPGFPVVEAATEATGTNPAGFPVQIMGNGMVLEWKRGYDDKPECWWIKDERRVSKAQSATYRHYAILKATPRAKWSKSFGAWYYTGGPHPPQKWLELVGYTQAGAISSDLAQQIEGQLERDQQAETPPETPAEHFMRLRREREEQQRQALGLAALLKPDHEFQAAVNLSRRFAESLYHLNACKALPAMATPSIDDPWS
jgi:hypothetical protein